jgi:lambda family phage portal protein
MADLARSLGRVVDAAVGVFSPQREQRRLLRRDWNIRYKRSMYAAAKVSRATGAWSPVNDAPNDILAASLPQVRARVRQLVRDFPYFGRAVRVLTDLTVGNGHQLQARILGSDGKPARDLNQRIEDAWAEFCDRADISGNQTLHEMARLAKRQDVECGEFLAVFVDDAGELRLQIYEPDWLSEFSARAQRGNQITQGIEYDPKSGRVVAYHLADPWSTGKGLRLLAEDVLHRFEILRPGQMRGISILVSGVLLAHDLGEFLDAELDAAKASASWVGYVKTQRLAQLQNQRGVAKDADTGKPFEKLNNALLEYLGPNEEMKLFSHDRPSGGLTVAEKLILRAIAVAAGISYELLSGDYEKISWSNLRGIRQDVNNQMAPHKIRHARHFYSPIYRRWLDRQVLRGRLDIPDYFRRRTAYQRHEFVAPALEDVDPLRTNKAYQDQMNSRVRSPQELIRARGREPREVLQEWAAWMKMLQEEGAPPPVPTSTALKQNPAAMGAKE